VYYVWISDGSDRISHLWFGFGKFLLKIPNFSIFFILVKKMSLVRVKKYPGQRGVGLLYSPSQEYARVGSGPISSLNGWVSNKFLQQYSWGVKHG